MSGGCLAPLYDVSSAWPIVGHGKNQLAPEKAKLAMALPGKRPHYRLKEITPHHFQELAKHTGLPGLWGRMQSLVESASPALERMERRLPGGFPERVYEKIRAGVQIQVRRFAQTAAWADFRLGVSLSAVVRNPAAAGDRSGERR